ncbi:MAG: hypothetical protein IPM29_24245 [Planctomycetes bacterium]|nr:hypothetical protein [Planctomycetota bacterium]
MPLPHAGLVVPIACLGMVVQSLLAQAGQIAPGANLGAGLVSPAGDVDDDGFADLVFDLGGTWEVRSGATGLPFPALTRVRVAARDRFAGLSGDLDADGCDDLVFTSPGTGVAEFRSGRDGSLLFAFTNPFLTSVSGAADHDADGADDVMVGYGDPVPGISHVDVLSGRGGAVLLTRLFQNTATSYRSIQWVGDVDGDGFVDLAQNLSSFAQRFHWVMAGPDWQRAIASNGGGFALEAFDTDGDGRDELLTDFGYFDPVTNRLVWSGPFAQAHPLDLDGDGAFDVVVNGQAYSGRTQTPFAGTMPSSPFWSIGDIDGDGRDEAVESGIVYELVGAPPASIVRDRGASGTTSTLSRPRIRQRLRPRLGETMLVDLRGGLVNGPAVAWFGSATEIDLGSIGAPGNHAYVLPIAGIAHLADAHGHARQSLAIPPTPALLGVALTVQWIVPDAAANPLGVVTSNALDLVIGH